MVIYKNLLAENDEIFSYGMLLENEKLFCLCGCGCFLEKGEYAIIGKFTDKSLNSSLQIALQDRRKKFFDILKEYRTKIFTYGYKWDGMYGITAKIGRLLFQYNVETYRLYEDNTEGAINDIAEFDSHDGWFGVEKKTLETAMKKGMLDDFFFEDWEEGIRPIKPEPNFYVVCMDSKYVRDSQMLNTKEMTDEQFEQVDWQSSDLDNFWHDMEPTPFVGIIKARNEEDAIEKAAERYRYDKRCLYGIEIISNESKPKEVYTLTVMATSDGKFDVSTRVFDCYETAKKEFDGAIDFQKRHTWMSDYRIEALNEKDGEIDEERVVECINSLNDVSGKELIWEAYREGYCSSMHSIIKLEKQIITKEAQNAK